MTALGLGPARVEAIACKLFGEPNRHLSDRRNIRFGRQGSLSVVLDRGVFHEEAARLLREDGDLPPRETAEDRQAREEAETRRRAARMVVAANLWRTGLVMTGSPAETYLKQARAIGAPLEDAALRFAAAAPLRPYAPDGAVSPALLARVVDGSGAPIGLHITYVRPDGSGKAGLAAPRKMVGLVGGGHVRLIRGDVLVVGEGLESTFSAWEVAATPRHLRGLGPGAALAAGGVAAFVWPRQTRELIISPDRDAGGAGERAARELARRADANGLSVAYLWPPEGLSDWNALRMRAR